MSDRHPQRRRRTGRRIADRIGEIENRPVECGELDITLFRDDGSAPEGYEDHSRLDFSIDGEACGAHRMM